MKGSCAEGDLKLNSPSYEYLTSMPYLQGTAASLQTENAHDWDIFVKPSLSTFLTDQDNFVPIQLQPEICSASTADHPRTFPALSPQMSIACKWIPHANEQLHEYDKTVLLFQFCDSRKTRQLHYLCVTLYPKPLLST